MNDSISTASSVRSVDGTGERVLHWLLLHGDRRAVAASIVLVIFLLVFGLVSLGTIAIGPSSTAASVFASGLVGGTLTLVTVALSINQLILSRVFGSPDELRDRLTGTRELRDRVRERADEHASPNDPAEFLSLVATTLAERADRLGRAIEDGDWDPPAAVEQYVADVEAYGENIDASIESQTDIVDVLSVVLGTEYARNLTATEHVRSRYAAQLGEQAREELAAIEDLLESVAIARQFFKTLSLQQDFARLSRLVAYSGLAAFLASLLLALVYRTDAVTIPLQYLPIVFSVGIAVIVTPLAAFIASVLRAATVANRTVSVGPFIPPEEREAE